MSLKDTIENNPVIWTLGILLAGFLAGVSAYRSVLEIANLQTIPKTAQIVQPGERVISEADYNAFTTRDTRATEKLAESVALNDSYKLILTSLATSIDGKVDYEMRELQLGHPQAPALSGYIKQLKDTIQRAKTDHLIDQ
jgi:hypothetical protein